MKAPKLIALAFLGMGAALEMAGAGSHVARCSDATFRANARE